MTKSHKVFFIHDRGDNDKCLVARPNYGIYTENKDSLRTKFNKGAFTRNPVSVQRAMEIWEREYELANIPYSDYYQMSCRGRHKESYVVSFSDFLLLSLSFFHLLTRQLSTPRTVRWRYRAHSE